MSNFYWALIVEHEADQYAEAPAVTLHREYDAALAALADEFGPAIEDWCEDGVPEGEAILVALRSYGVRAWIDQVGVPA